MPSVQRAAFHPQRLKRCQLIEAMALVRLPLVGSRGASRPDLAPTSPPHWTSALGTQSTISLPAAALRALQLGVGNGVKNIGVTTCSSTITTMTTKSITISSKNSSL